MTSVKTHLARCIERYDGVLKSDLNTADPKLQEQIVGLMEDLRVVWHHFEATGGLSRNEELDDVSTAALQVITVPYLLGDLQLRVANSAEKREEILERGRKLLNEFLTLCVNLKIAKEEEVEVSCRVQSASRTLRVEQHREKKELGSKLATLDSKLQYMAARSAQLQRIMDDEEASATVDASSEEEDALRERGITHIRLCVLEAYSTLHLAEQELEMLSRLSVKDREKISTEYQANIEAAKRGENPSGQETYTILPGGMIATNTSLRQTVRDDAFNDPNPPTMSLSEFAQMQLVKHIEHDQQEHAAAEVKRREDEALGAEGIEERDRQKAAKWDDWKDAHPPIGKTTKGNYT